MASWIPRLGMKTLHQLARGFPVVSVTGPRQSGKSTLARAAFPDHPYVTLELPADLDWARTDPTGFLDRFPEGAILDEIQRCPELFSHLQVRVDENRSMGQYVITGSQQFGMNERISQSLAGRVGGIVLLPFTREEIAGAGRAPSSLDAQLTTGFYPAIYDRDLAPHLWYGNYVSTYVERDVRQIQAIRDLETFRTFLRLCAGRTAQLLNLASLANDVGISAVAARQWVSILQASYIVHLLPPYHRNFNKRLVKSPKLYFLDCGLAAHLVGISEPQQVTAHPLRGPLFETYVVGEMLKRRFNAGRAADLFFWRDSHGHEVDVLRQDGPRVTTVEAKAGATVDSAQLAGLEYWRSLAGTEAGASYLVHGGNTRGRRGGCEILPWTDAGAI
ncbi:MAG: ATP-binding protein [Candidatus Krumholzibacteriia bacterium]